MLTSKRSKFTLPPQVTYLNCAYMSPLLKDAEKAGIRALRGKRTPFNIQPADFFNEADLLRSEYAKLVNGPEANRFAIIPSVSYGMANVARNVLIKKDQHILITTDQFFSNYHPWKALSDETGATIKSIAAPAEFTDRGKQWNDRILEAINKHTRIVAIPHVHWVDGTRFDLEAIRKRTREVDTLLVVDGTQSVGAMPFDIQKIQPDALVCGSYKWLLGPYSIGLAYYGEFFDTGKPIEESWMNRLGSENFSDVSYKETYKPGALRYEVGEHSSFIHVAMLIKSIQQLNQWRPERIQEYCAAITANSISRLREKGFVIENEDWRGAHLFGIRFPETTIFEKVKASLIKHKIYVSVRGNSLRIAPNVYNTERDLERLTKVLLKAL